MITFLLVRIPAPSVLQQIFFPQTIENSFFQLSVLRTFHTFYQENYKRIAGDGKGFKYTQPPRPTLLKGKKERKK